eukprot:TRINITY_DN5866_c0_g3_i1.p1 TRINITY_DN5866_c0_g3~~TRINITY_DN5866_c0_g3_i1.p1  ORF type:complete len:190 (+),score=19.70 TRINITY_DN5866_c0_g3_i1:16-585(+)
MMMNGRASFFLSVTLVVLLCCISYGVVGVGQKGNAQMRVSVVNGTTTYIQNTTILDNLAAISGLPVSQFINPIYFNSSVTFEINSTTSFFYASRLYNSLVTNPNSLPTDIGSVTSVAILNPSDAPTSSAASYQPDGGSSDGVARRNRIIVICVVGSVALCMMACACFISILICSTAIHARKTATLVDAH